MVLQFFILVSLFYQFEEAPECFITQPVSPSHTLSMHMNEKGEFPLRELT